MIIPVSIKESLSKAVHCQHGFQSLSVCVFRMVLFLWQFHTCTKCILIISTVDLPPSSISQHLPAPHHHFCPLLFFSSLVGAVHMLTDFRPSTWTWTSFQQPYCQRKNPAPPQQPSVAKSLVLLLTWTRSSQSAFHSGQGRRPLTTHP